MAARPRKTNDAELEREIQLFSMKALALAKPVADGSIDEAGKKQARELASQLPALAAKSRELSDAYRESATRSLSEARLDLSYVSSGGKVPSSIRIGQYIAERKRAG